MDEAVLQGLADRQLITDLLHRYCRAVDRLDVPLGRSVWHADGLADYGENFYQGPGRDVIDLICRQHSGLLQHSHQLANILIALDGDEASSESYVTATLRMRRDGRLLQMSVWSRYVDRWARRGGRWGITKRIAIREFDEIREVTAMAEHDTGRRDRSDPSYALPGFDKGFGEE